MMREVEIFGPGLLELAGCSARDLEARRCGIGAPALHPGPHNVQCIEKKEAS
jgi:hypothetical protein